MSTRIIQNWGFWIAFLASVCFWIGACKTPVVTDAFIKEAPVVPSSYEANGRFCSEKLNYQPDVAYPEHTPMRYIRINFHVMKPKDGKANLDERTGVPFIKAILEAANEKLTRNSQMRLPLGNSTPIIPMRYQYVLTPKSDDPDDDGIYFHYDDELYAMVANGKDKNNFDREVYEKYGVQKDSVMNIFIMSTHRDSMQSDTYSHGSRGVGFGRWVKLAGWDEYTQEMKTDNRGRRVYKERWKAQRLLHHEVGHCLGLKHTWAYNDGCDDTPEHPNCWSETNEPPCDEEWGNNFMDYNTHSSAWSPCQIASIHHNLSRDQGRCRQFLIPTWCTLDESQTISITDQVLWNSRKDLNGNIIIENGGQLTIRCRVSLPKNARIVINAGGKLIIDGGTIDNICGDQWLGIQQNAKDGQKGELILAGDAQILNVQNEIKKRID